METTAKRTKNNNQTIKRKRRKLSSPLLQNADADTLFAVMLATLGKDELRNPNSQGILTIRRCLDQILRSLLSNSSNPNPIPILSLLPSFLNSKCGKIVCTSLEIVGAASLSSFEMNNLIASDIEIMKGLLAAVASPKRSISVSALNAVLDLSTTSIGCQQLLEFSAIDKLIFQFIQTQQCSAESVSLFMEDAGCASSPIIGFMGDEGPLLLLHAATVLINACTSEQLEKIQWELSKCLLSNLKKLWAEVQKQIQCGNIPLFFPEGRFHLSNIRVNNLAESIFRLSMLGSYSIASGFSQVKRSIFDLGDLSFESFILSHWEISPVLITRPSKFLTEDNGIFSSFGMFLRSKEAVPSFPASLLQNLTAALPINSDEIDVINFLKEERTHLGCPMIYQQDVRVLKTQKPQGEMHYFQNACGSKNPHFLYAGDIMKFEEAFKEGFTIALRGMEFHFESIAAIADGLASLFGQPSAGVNMYLTPPNSQGLACHRDDHCVLICQLSGVKRWKVYPKLDQQLPRLYEPVDYQIELEGKSPQVVRGSEYLMKEGDVLYIPRGFPHEACTVDDDAGNVSTGFSLHLTLAIEIEPPFEWEGFAHIALHHWARNKNLLPHISGDPLSWDMNVVALSLMHLAVMLNRDADSAFQKACLVGALWFPLINEGRFYANQKATFSCLINKINSASRFSDVVNYLEAAILKHEDPFQNLRWLLHLKEEEPLIEEHYLNISQIGTENLYHLLVQHKEKAEATFMNIKSKFCSEIVYEDVEGRYKLLLAKYRKARRQYTNGMLSLHCNQS